MVNRSLLLKLLPFIGKEDIIYPDANNDNIIQLVKGAVQRGVELTAPIAHLFKGETDEQTVFNVFDFLLNQIQYKADGTNQQVKQVTALIRYPGDCKSYAVFAAAVFFNLYLPTVTIRFVSFDGKMINHVYAIADGIICDAVYKHYNEEAPYIFKKDFVLIDE